MNEGKFEISGTIGGFILFGLSYKNLYFSNKETIIQLISNNQTMHGYYCVYCKLSIYDQNIEENNKYSKVCKKCGTFNGHGGDKCISCGNTL
mgnify:FL=1